ncbi:MAG: hypothetical protein FWH17_05285 [Oscillospiraceae bacterium]|nr:hypothetical protein [Oscillospiraceae bacterium]
MLTHIKRTIGDRAFSILAGGFFSVFTLICFFPIYYLFINTISDNSLVQAGQVNLLPKGVHFGNYTALLNVPDLFNSALISVWRTVLGTLTMVLASAFVGYLVTQQKMFARKIVYRFIIITMYGIGRPRRYCFVWQRWKTVSGCFTRRSPFRLGRR